MSRNNNAIPNDVKMKLESVNNNVRKIEKSVNNVLDEIKHQNLPQKKNIISDKMLSTLTLIVAFVSLLVACYTTYSSNKLAINNSALNFTYENMYENKTKNLNSFF